MSQAQQMIKHSTIYAIGNISRQLVGFIMLPVYTHYLSPSDYGVIGLLIFLVSLFEIILGGHMFQAVPKFYHKERNVQEKNSVITTALLVTTVFSGISCALMSGFSENISRVVFGNTEYSIYVTIFSALILTHALEQYGLTYLRIVKKPWTYFNFSMVKLALQLTLNIITIVVLDWGLMGLALSSLISSILIAFLLVSYTLYQTGFSLKRRIAKNILRFSWPLWLSGAVGLYIGSSNRYYIRIFSSLDDVGLFELAAKFGGIVMILIWTPFSQYWQTERFSIANQQNPYPAYSLAFRLISASLITSGIGVVLFSRTIINIMSAEEFHPASDAVLFLVIAAIFQSLTIFNNFSFMYTERTLEVTKNNLFTAVAITILYFLFIPYFGFVGASLGYASGSALQYIYALRAGNRIYPLRISQKPFAYAIAVVLVAGFVERFLYFDGVSVTYISYVVGLTIFSSILVILILFDRSEIQLTFRTIFSYIKKRRQS